MNCPWLPSCQDQQESSRDVPLISLVLINWNGVRMEVFLQEISRGCEHAPQALTRSHTPRWGWAESGSETWTQRGSFWSFFPSNPPEGSWGIFWQTLPMYSIYKTREHLCYIFFFLPTSHSDNPKPHFLLCSTDIWEDHKCIPFYRLAWLKPALPRDPIMKETHGFCQETGY